MKKIIALVLALVMGLTPLSVAFAAENYSNDSTTQVVNGRAFESVRVAVTADGKLAAVKTLQSAYSTLKGWSKEEIENISSVLKSGGILRAKGLIKGSLDERNMLAEGSTSVLLALEVVNLEQLQEALGGVDPTITAVTVMDCASIAHDGHIGHRCVDRPTNLVARFHQQNGSTINLFYDTFDGAKKLVFDAEAISQPPAPEKPVVTPAPEKPVVTPAPEKPIVTPEPQKPVVTPEPEKPATTPRPNPENDDVILPWDNAPSSGSTGNTNAGGSYTQTPSQEPKPAPENDDVVLPWA